MRLLKPTRWKRAMQTDLSEFCRMTFRPSHLKRVRPSDFGVIHLRGMMGSLTSFNLSRAVEPPGW